MKQKFSLLLAVIISFFFSTAFTPIPTTPQPMQNNQTKASLSGTWYISSYGTEEMDMTALFSGYELGFNTKGGVVANYREESTQGTYTYSKAGLTFDFYESELLANLNGTWITKERSESMMYLVNDHGYHLVLSTGLFVDYR